MQHVRRRLIPFLIVYGLQRDVKSTECRDTKIKRHIYQAIATHLVELRDPWKGLFKRLRCHLHVRIKLRVNLIIGVIFTDRRMLVQMADSPGMKAKAVGIGIIALTFISD